METLIDYLKVNKPKGFTPRPFYSVEGDSLTFYFKDDASYRERVDDFLTVYRSMKEGELIGCQIKGLSRALKLLGVFGCIIEDESVRLEMIFLACMASTPERSARDRYLELRQAAPRIAIPAKELESILT